MRIAGIQRCSFVDYPGHLAAAVFTAGCNWDCFYCHNRSIIANKPGEPKTSSATQEWWTPQTALAWLKTRCGWLEGVVITGGEPTLQAGLEDFVLQVRSLGYLVKLDTNGSRPAVLRRLVEQGLLDYVAMDIKAPLDKYNSFCGIPVDHNAVNESIDLLLSRTVDYEFRTTVVPQLDEEDVLAIARRIRGANSYVLQQYRPPAHWSFDSRLQAPAHEPTWPWPILDELHALVASCETRGFERSTQTTAHTAA